MSLINYKFILTKDKKDVQTDPILSSWAFSPSIYCRCRSARKAAIDLWSRYASSRSIIRFEKACFCQRLIKREFRGLL